MLEIWFHSLQGEVVMQKDVLGFKTRKAWFILWQAGAYLNSPSYSIAQSQYYLESVLQISLCD